MDLLQLQPLPPLPTMLLPRLLLRMRGIGEIQHRQRHQLLRQLQVQLLPSIQQQQRLLLLLLLLPVLATTIVGWHRLQLRP